MILARSWPPSWPHRRPGNLLFTSDEPPYSEPGEGGHGQREPKQQSPQRFPGTVGFGGFQEALVGASFPPRARLPSEAACVRPDRGADQGSGSAEVRSRPHTAEAQCVSLKHPKRGRPETKEENLFLPQIFSLLLVARRD